MVGALERNILYTSWIVASLLFTLHNLQPALHRCSAMPALWCSTRQAGWLEIQAVPAANSINSTDIYHHYVISRPILGSPVIFLGTREPSVMIRIVRRRHQLYYNFFRIYLQPDRFGETEDEQKDFKVWSRPGKIF